MPKPLPARQQKENRYKPKLKAWSTAAPSEDAPRQGVAPADAGRQAGPAQREPSRAPPGRRAKSVQAPRTHRPCRPYEVSRRTRRKRPVAQKRERKPPSVNAGRDVLGGGCDSWLDSLDPAARRSLWDPSRASVYGGASVMTADEPAVEAPAPAPVVAPVAYMSRGAPARPCPRNHPKRKARPRQGDKGHLGAAAGLPAASPRSMRACATNQEEDSAARTSGSARRRRSTTKKYEGATAIRGRRRRRGHRGRGPARANFKASARCCDGAAAPGARTTHEEEEEDEDAAAPEEEDDDASFEAKRRRCARRRRRFGVATTRTRLTMTSRGRGAADLQGQARCSSRAAASRGGLRRRGREDERRG